MIRKISIRVVSLLPTNGLRRLGYRLLGYDVRGSRIGWATRIETDGFTAIDCTIGSRNLFAGPMTVTIGPGTLIGSGNTFQCGSWSMAAERDLYARELTIGARCVITGNHWFDATGRVVIGDDSWIAGRDTQFWTHGLSEGTDVVIGKRCYIGSAVRFAPGSRIGDDCLVGIGSVVVKPIDATHALIGGVPARVIRQAYDWQPSKHAGAELDTTTP